MNYSLLIFQFGLNVASPEARGFKWYENAMVEVVEYYSKLIPEADILIISIGDKSYKYDMEYVTQPGIPKLVEAQRNIAKRTKSHFWNLYQTMGGYNSMRTWVESSKPLASKDYAHINFRGAEKISKTLSENIFNEFQLYEYNLLKDKEKQILFEAIAELNSKLNNNFLSFSSQYENVILNNSLLSKSDGTRNIEPSDVEEHNDTTDKGLIKADTVIDSYEFRVQIAASKSEIEMNSYNHLLQKAPDKILRKIQHKDGFKRLYITPFYSFKEAQAVADTLIQNGHDAFVVGFINEDRAAIEKVKSKQKEYLASNTINSTPKQEDINIPEETDTDASIKFVKLKEYPRWLKVLSFDDIYYQRFYEKDTLMNYTLGWRIDTVLTSPTLIHGELPVFRVQFCASEIELDVDFYQNIIDFFGDSMIIISKDDDGMIRYMLGDYASFEDASEALNTVFELKQDGFITAYYYNKRIKPERAISIIKNKTKQ